MPAGLVIPSLGHHSGGYLSHTTPDKHLPNTALLAGIHSKTRNHPPRRGRMGRLLSLEGGGPGRLGAGTDSQLLAVHATTACLWLPGRTPRNPSGLLHISNGRKSGLLNMPHPCNMHAMPSLGRRAWQTPHTYGKVKNAKWEVGPGAHTVSISTLTQSSHHEKEGHT